MIPWLVVGFVLGLLVALSGRRRGRPAKIVLPLPLVTRNGVPMPNLEILNDTVVTIPIQTQDSAGVVVAPPTGDTFTAVSSLPNSLGAAVVVDANGNPDLVLTPL